MPVETHVGLGGVWRNLSEWHVDQGGTRRDLKEAYMGQGGVWRKIFEKLTVPVFTGSNSNDAQSTPTINTGAVTPTSVNDILIAICSVTNVVEPIDLAIDTPGYTEFVRIDDGLVTPVSLMVAAWKVAGSISPQSAVFSSTVASPEYVAAILNVSGAHQTVPIHMVNSVEGVGSSASAASLSPTIPEYLGLTVFSHGSNDTLGLSGTGWAEIAQHTAPVFPSLIWGQKPNGSGSSGNVDFTAFNSREYFASQFLIAPP